MKAYRRLVVLSFVLVGVWTGGCTLDTPPDLDRGYFDSNGDWVDGFDARHCGRDKNDLSKLVDCFAKPEYANAKEDAVTCVLETEWKCQIVATQEHPCNCGYQYDVINDKCVRADREYIGGKSANEINCKEYDVAHCGIKDEYKEFELSDLYKKGIDAYINCEDEMLNATDVACKNIAAPGYEYRCTASACASGFHTVPVLDAELQKCVEDTVEACGSFDNDCTTKEGVLTEHVFCENGQCKADACKDDYYLDTSDSVCKPQTVENCGSNGEINCKEAYPGAVENSLSCENGVCIVRCIGDEIRSETGECFTQSWTACGPKKRNCFDEFSNADPDGGKAVCFEGECKIQCNMETEVQGYGGRCISKVCEDGFRWVENGETGLGDCMPNNSIEHCGVAAGTDQGADCRLSTGFELALCMHPTDNINKLMLDLQCNEKTAQEVVEAYTTENTRYAEFVCSAVTCRSGYSIKITKNEEAEQTYYSCESYDLKSCGSNKVDCTAEPFWEGGKCFVDDDGKGNCVATSCKVGGYLDLIKCRPNTAVSCGAPNHACKSNEFCGIRTRKDEAGNDVTEAACLDACPNGQDSENRVCYDNQTSIQYCGIKKVSCIANHRGSNESVRTCDNGVCNLESCLEGYHRCLDNDSENPCECSGAKDANGYCCEKNTKEHCGIERSKCKSQSVGGGIPGGASLEKRCSSGSDGATCTSYDDVAYTEVSITMCEKTGTAEMGEVGVVPGGGFSPAPQLIK